MLPEIEEHYRQSYLAADIKQAKVGVLLLLIPLIVFFLNDYFFFALTTEFYFLTALRFGFVAYSVLFFVYLSRLKSTRQYYRSEFVWGLLGIGLQLTINASRPQTFLFHVIMVIVIVFVTCLVIPQTFVRKIILSFTLTIGELAIIVIGMPTIALTALFSVVFSLAMANIIGLSMSKLMESYRFRAFKVQTENVRLASFPVLNPNPIVEVDLDGKINYVNSAAERAFPDLKIADLSHPLFFGWADVVSVFKDEKKQTLKRDIQIGDSWFNQQLHLVSETGQVRIYFNNITTEKQAEEALRLSEQRWATTLTSIGDGVIATDNAGKITFMNAVAESLTGWTLLEASEMPLEEVFKIVNEQTRLKGENPVAKVLKSGHIVGLANHTALVRKDSTQIPIDDSAAPIKDQNGNITGVVLVFRDRTERKITEEELRTAKEYLDNLLNYANAPIIVWDNENKITLFNNAFEAFTGFKRGQVLGNKIEVLFPHAEKERILQTIMKASQGEKWQSVEIPILCASKETRIALWNSANIKDKTGNIVATIAQGQDITERKEAEEKLKENHNRAELMNEKLRVSGSMTRHDVRNKLSVIAGNVYLLKKKHANQADIVVGLGKIELAINEAGRIFEFAKLYEQLGVEDLKYVDVEKALNEATVLFQNLPFRVVNNCQDLTVWADSLLSQLFYNLIDNTNKYGEKTTTVQVLCEKAKSGELRLIYEDNGVGISKENKPKLFTEGFSTGSSTGFGLFLIKKMMDIYGWTITEEGEPGKGAKFVITIPKLNKNGKENFQTA